LGGEYRNNQRQGEQRTTDSHVTSRAELRSSAATAKFLH
jgi:hypothetical protein